MSMEKHWLTVLIAQLRDGFTMKQIVAGDRARYPSITVVVSKNHDPKSVRALADVIWAAQKDNTNIDRDVREQMKGLCSALHAEAARLEANNR